MNDHIILCGLGKVGINILELLRELDEPVVTIAREVPMEWRRRAQLLATRFVIADARDEGVLAEADIHRARAIVIVTDDDLANVEIAVDARRASPDVAVVVRMSDLEVAEGLRRELRPRAVLNPAALAAPAFAAAALGRSVLRSFAVEDAAVNIVAVGVAGPDTGAGQGLQAYADSLDLVPIAVRAGFRAHALAPSPDSVLAPGDEVVAAVRSVGLPGLPLAAHPDHPEDAPEPTHGIWTRLGEVKHTLGSIWRTASAPIRYAFVALHLVGVVSTLVFRSVLDLSWVDAIYFTVTVMTTVGFGDLNLGGASPLVKLFGCLVMISGVALTFTFFSVFAEYLASRRFETAMGARRVTLAGHFIVAGLGRLGFAVAQRLKALRHDVVVVERDHSAECLGRLPAEVPVLLGDADQPRLMALAGVRRARTVIAVTDDDLANLRIAQHARAASHRVRTVVRLFHSNLAGKLDPDCFGIDAPVNPSQVAAGTFVACALAPDVLHGFMLGGRLMLLRWLDAVRQHQCEGLTVGELRARGILVVLRRPSDGAPVVEPARTDRIGPGERLVVVEQYRAFEHLDAPAGTSVPIGVDTERHAPS